MTYAMGWPLQKAVFDLLSASPDVQALADGGIHDGAPQEKLPGGDARVHVQIGDDTAQDWSTSDAAGASHQITLSVIAPGRSFAQAKALAGAISDALLVGPLALERGHAVLVAFMGAKTKREERDMLRRIDLRFRVLVEDAA